MVNHCQSKEKEDYAVKIYSVENGTETAPFEVKAIMNEILFLRELKQCKNIVQLHSAYYERTHEKTKFILVMNLAKHGSLLHKLNTLGRRFTNEEVRTIMIQLLLSVDLMHRLGIVHRDLKPDNVLMIEEETLNVCITDLGMACKANDLS